MNTRHKLGDRIVVPPEDWADIDDEVTREILTSDVLSRHTADLSRYRDARGEFKQWLHIFHVAIGNTRFKTTTVIPWLSDETEVDLEFHQAAMALGAYAQYPLNWRSFSWQVNPFQTTPVYRVFTSSPSQSSFDEAIRKAAGVVWPKYKDPVFWDRMRRLVLVPRTDGGLVPSPVDYNQPPLPRQRSYDDANSRLGEDCATALRSGQYCPPDRAAGLRQIPGDPTRDHRDPE